jgi:hypothetical protein
LNKLGSFPSFDLTTLDAADLLERKDFKYVFKAVDLVEILNRVEPFYKVLKVNDLLYTDYITHYYDTKDFKFYIQHHNGEANRYKIRLRSYVQSKLFFYEEKFKNNKNWTSKVRRKIADLDSPIDNFTAHLQHNSLEKKIHIHYTRITLLSRDNAEKITLDLNLNFENQSSRSDYSDICIAEVKSKTHHPYIFRQTLKEMGYSTTGLSKYCFGIINLYKEIKSNNFKPLIRHINKLRHEPILQ